MLHYILYMNYCRIPIKLWLRFLQDNLQSTNALDNLGRLLYKEGEYTEEQIDELITSMRVMISDVATILQRGGVLSATSVNMSYALDNNYPGIRCRRVASEEKVQINFPPLSNQHIQIFKTAMIVHFNNGIGKTIKDDLKSDHQLINILSLLFKYRYYHGVIDMPHPTLVLTILGQAVLLSNNVQQEA